MSGLKFFCNLFWGRLRVRIRAAMANPYPAYVVCRLVTYSCRSQNGHKRASGFIVKSKAIHACYLRTHMKRVLLLFVTW